jgi:hypothetical protein
MAPPPEPQGWTRLLQTRPVINRAASLEPEGAGSVLAKVPSQPLPWLVPPLSWIIRPRSHRTLRIDGLGYEVFDLARKEDRVESVVDRFAERHGLTFHESRVAVTGYLKTLTEKGVLVLIGEDDAA